MNEKNLLLMILSISMSACSYAFDDCKFFESNGFKKVGSGNNYFIKYISGGLSSIRYVEGTFVDESYFSSKLSYTDLKVSSDGSKKIFFYHIKDEELEVYSSNLASVNFMTGHVTFSNMVYSEISDFLLECDNQ